MKFVDGIDNNIGKFEYIERDVITTPFFIKDYCDHLISLFEDYGFEIDEDGNYDLLMSHINDGNNICNLFLDYIEKYVEPEILKNWTPTIKNRLWASYPVPFCKKFSNTGQNKLKLHNDNSLFTLFIKLNDDYGGCETIFPRQNWDLNKIPVGHLVVFPGSITHPHFAKKLNWGTKYSLVGRISILLARNNEFDNIRNLMLK